MGRLRLWCGNDGQSSDNNREVESDGEMSKWYVPYVLAAIVLWVGSRVLYQIAWQVWALEMMGFDDGQIKNIIERRRGYEAASQYNKV